MAQNLWLYRINTTGWITDELESTDKRGTLVTTDHIYGYRIDPT
jgi:hypothetical protein